MELTDILECRADRLQALKRLQQSAQRVVIDLLFKAQQSNMEEINLSSVRESYMTRTHGFFQ
ncbi:uncharacterized protein LOC143076770 isoform X2 [Mytilus galloprovincialis]|uniref:uncharacterized protein LOC143076770 isoform X2 n=1 Tax=Mytilus galloprovincialis TaxID=29158 RepID=UPI003F7CB297